VANVRKATRVEVADENLRSKIQTKMMGKSVNWREELSCRIFYQFSTPRGEVPEGIHAFTHSRLPHASLPALN